jgi:dTMP kinase
MPDLTILLEASEARIAERLAQRDAGRSDAIGGRGANYHREVARHFRGIAQAEPGAFAILNADGTFEAVHAAIRALVEPLIAASPA